MSFIRVASSRLSGDRIEVNVQIEDEDGEVIGYPEGLSEGERNPVEVRGVELERINAGGEYNIYKLPEGRPLLVTALTRSGVDRRIDEFRQEVGNPGLSPIYLYTGSKRPVYLGIYERGGDGSNKGRMKRVRIEPVGVVVIGIDGLRQDVLYDSTEESVKEEGANYYIEPGTLSGLGEIMKPESTVKVRDVSAVFPSITLASWASIFTGKPPKYTGILGNEFYARDLYNASTPNNTIIPGMSGLPSGMITLSDGAFKNSRVEFLVKHLLPAHNYYETVSEKMGASSPNQLLKNGADTIYKWIGEYGGIRGVYNTVGGEYRSGVIYNHYARDTDYWGTQDLPFYYGLLNVIPGLTDWFKDIINPVVAARALDTTPRKEFDNFIGKYCDAEIKICKKHFPVLFTIYFGGPDHYAHDIGLDGSGTWIESYNNYIDFIKKHTDEEISEIVKTLKDYDEFDNKIFIITSDHGHTGMPTDLPPMLDEDGNLYKTDMS